MARYRRSCSSFHIQQGGSTLGRRIRQIAGRMPEMGGAPIRVAFRKRVPKLEGQIHAGAFLRKRQIIFEQALRHDDREFARIFTHEIFHFAWWRLGNARRLSYERLMESEIRSGVPGELGWSAEWRKQALSPGDRTSRNRRWREYVCESFCDSAAWLFSGVSRHPEFTLPLDARKQRRLWFQRSGAARRISV